MGRVPFYTGMFLLFFSAGLGSCKDDDAGSTSGYDPSRSVVFTGFSPDEGSLRTEFYIQGENFGTDPAKVHVSIGGQTANTIGCNGHEIYCMVPRRAFDGTVRVCIESSNGRDSVDYVFEKKFNYISQNAVGTLCGSVDEYGDAGNKDGTFEEAEFQSPDWVLLDTFHTEKRLLITQTGTSIRCVNLESETVTTLITEGQGSFSNMQYTSFDETGDTLFVSDDNGQNNQDLRQIAYLLREENFRKANAYTYDKCGYSNAYCNATHTLYYNTYWKAALQKAVYSEETKQNEPVEVFPVFESSDAHTYLFIHPDGLYMYIVGNQCISKSMWDEQTREFQEPTVFAGSLGSSGWVDAPGTTARFSDPWQGVFVRNEEYAKAGKEDEYDFYVCDRNNHCIRKVTPEGIVSTYAGRGSASVDGNVWGYIDGALRTEARFNQPCGICYDPEEEIFYVIERETHRIRTISVQ